ncbi:MAG: epoxide hydrolase [Robiginitomaculum sp.]|nr:MAG: epoxide hydrolase [Robiginitomaculum sp.]
MPTRITLSNGGLRFPALACGLKENPDGPVAICLHGFPDTHHTFFHQLPALAGAGYRAIAPMMRGFTPSSQPENHNYALGTLARDVIAWCDDLGASQVHLIGHDWGAAVAYIAGAMAPERFLSLSTIAVPHAARFADGIKAVPGQLLKSWYMTFFQLRGLAEWAVARKDWALVRKLWQDWSPDYSLAPEDWALRREVFAAPGVKTAMLAYYRQNASPAIMFGLKKTEASLLTTVPVPTLAITGAEDGCIDTRLYDHVFMRSDFPKGLSIERIAGAGHFVHLEKPEAINALLLDWLNTH